MKRLGSAAARLLRTADRLLSALLMAAAVTLLAAGLLWYGSPTATSADLAYGGPTPPPTSAPLADPGNFPSPTPTRTISATAVVTTSAPIPATTASPSATAGDVASPTPSTLPSPVASGTAGDPAVATRVVIPSLEIDLPIVSRDLPVPNQGPDQYPPCDVAIYHTAFVQPGQDGTTYLYGHARDGMFLPLLTAAEQHNGASLIGDLVEVYTDDDLRYVYAITMVKRHALDFSIAENLAPGVQQLVLQTSEGPRGTVPKLQVLAALQDVLPADPDDSHPKAHPRACYDTP